MGTVALPITPSCSDCISWSDDGDLAIAGGEHVHILTPKNAQERNSGPASQSSTGTGPWHIARIRTNAFSAEDWPLVEPTRREDFSIGREQSTSHVVGIGWSSAGLGRHRRCVLAVLTANLYLSFYEPVALGRWVRTGIVNHALGRYFGRVGLEERRLARKGGVRTFGWCEPLKVTDVRWGRFLLTVTNDDDDVVCLEVKRSSIGSERKYSIEVLSLTTLHDLEENYAAVQPASVLAQAVNAGIRTSALSCGPCVSNDDFSATALVGVVYGTKLKLVKIDFSTQEGAGEQAKLTAAKMAEFGAHKIPNHHFTKPLRWLSTDKSSEIGLAAGTVAGLVQVHISRDEYSGKATINGTLKTQAVPFYEPMRENDKNQQDQRHWEPIGAMTTISNSPDSSTLHIGTTGGYTAALSFPGDTKTTSPTNPAWTDPVDDLKSTFDITHDLGGLVCARIWGLDHYHGLIAAAVSMHPGDMVEYRTAANTRVQVIISPAMAQPTEERGDVERILHGQDVDTTPENMRAKREGVLGFILHQKNGDICKKILYSAACCAVVESENTSLRSNAQEVLESLAMSTGADLSDEIQKCTSGPAPIAAKSAEQINGPGGEIYEKCDICDAGIEWYSAREAQCVSGHMFVRCNLSFLAIQEPGISKICPKCGSEYLDEELLVTTQEHENVQQTCRLIANAFDTCIYCGDKFRD